MERPSLGHELFERWLISTYGVSTRSPGRPLFKGLQATRKLIAKALEDMGGGTRLPPPKQGIALYHWLASARSGRTTPRKYIRVAIETITNGAVPREAWLQPGAAVGFAADDRDTEQRLAAAGGER